MKKLSPLKLWLYVSLLVLFLFGAINIQDWIVWRNNTNATAAFARAGLPFIEVPTPNPWIPDYIEAPNILSIGGWSLSTRLRRPGTTRLDLTVLLEQARRHTISTGHLTLRGPLVDDMVVAELTEKMEIYSLHLLDTQVTDAGLLNLTNSYGLAKLRLIVPDDNKTINTNTLTTLSEHGIETTFRTYTPRNTQ